MPSLRDLTGLDADIEVLDDGPAPPHDVLARVKTEGLRRRNRRHRRNGVLAAIALAIVAVPAIALLPGDDPTEDVRVANDPDAESSEDGAPPTTEEVVEPATTATTVSVSTVTTTPAPPTTVSDTELGPATQIERDEPPATTTPPTTTPPTTAPPADQPLTASFSAAPATAAVGEAVTFVVQWSDPDANLTYDYFSTDGTALAQPCTSEQGGGATPAPAGGTGELTYEGIVFNEAGDYLVTVVLATADCNSPFGSERTIETTITVS